jgi:putative inorganic carbon (HCO3(-)) transporter
MGLGIFEFIRVVFVPILYVGGIATVILAIFKKAEWGLLLMVALIPQPNIFYKLYPYPMGKDLLDILFIAVGIGIFVNKGGFEKGGNSVLILLLLLMSYFALWNSSRNFSLPFPISYANPMIKPWKGYAFMVGMYLLTFNATKGEENQRKILVTLMAVVVLFISFRSFRSFTPESSFIEDSRAVGPFWIVGLGSNHFAAFVVYCSAFFLGVFLLDENRWRKILFLLLVLFSLHPLFFSYSRGAYLAALGVLVFLGLLRKRSLLILAVVLLVTWKTLLPSSVVERIEMTESKGGEIEESAAIRLDLWDLSLRLFREHPVIGLGFGGFEFSLPMGGRWKDTHNYYLKMLSEQGIIGFALLFITLLMAFRSGWKLSRGGKNGFERGLGLGFMACVVASATTNLFGDRWSYFEIGSYFWVFWGLVDRVVLLAPVPVEAGNENQALETYLVDSNPAEEWPRSGERVEITEFKE